MCQFMGERSMYQKPMLNVIIQVESKIELWVY
jgi:hypothetical protein